MSKKKLGGPSIPRLLNFDHGPSWLTLPLVLALASPAPATAQLAAPPTAAYDNKSMSIIMGVVVTVFFLSVFLSLYSRQCAHRRHTPMRRHLDLAFPIRYTRPTSGLDPEIIQSFPSFLYSTVKGRGALACAVCLNEYEDDETLCLIPKCSHVFHPDCINAWLASHYTCPVCRANLLVPAQKDTSFLALEIPDPSHSDFQQQNESDRNVESPKVNLLHRSGTMNQNHGPSRSRSTGFLMAILFPRSHSMGHTDTVVQPGEDWDRFTLRLQQPNSCSTLKRTKSCVTFARMSSGRRGYRTRSVGSARGRNYLQLQYDRFASNTLTNRPPLHLMDNVDEASSDRLYPN